MFHSLMNSFGVGGFLVCQPPFMLLFKTFLHIHSLVPNQWHIPLGCEATY